LNLVLTCEHGGNKVPAKHRSLFEGEQRALDSHRGWDPGALDLARQMARRTKRPLVSCTTTRLLVDLNRTRKHPSLFSEWSRRLTDAEREDLLNAHWQPHRAALLEHLEQMRGETTLHLSVHSFTPRWKGRVRNVDIGLLHDPSRRREREVVLAWRKAILELDPTLRVYLNRPYFGTADGLTTELRGKLPARDYLGIEIEVSQRFPQGTPTRWARLRSDLTNSLVEVLDGAP
tara:strand:- start:702 stop:1397 length:696 start_codon:yes stop_codon:yes gene_type:complete